MASSFDNREKIEAYIEAHKDEMLEFWKFLVDTASQARERNAALDLCNKLEKVLVENGFECTQIDVGEVNSHALLGVLGADRPGAPVLFSGHYDTVSLPGDHPFRFDEEGQIRLGGGSDASYITMAGVPTVCSMGVRGEFNHTDREYALPNSLFERAELLANVVDHIDEFAAGKER